MSEVPSASWRIKEWFPGLNALQHDQLFTLNDEISKFNRTLSLVSAKTVPFMDAIHFADSILGSQLVHQDQPHMKEIFDLGSGAGFPGLVFAILFPQIHVILVESDQKKGEFLSHCKEALKLSNISVQSIPLESLGADRVTYCMARGLSSLSKAILMTRKIVKSGGVFYHFKGETWPAEVGEIPTQLCSVWTPALVGEYKLPIGSFRFGVVKTTKIA